MRSVCNIAKTIWYSILLLLRKDKVFIHSIERERNATIKYHYLFEKHVLDANYEGCFNDLVCASEAGRKCANMDLELFIASVLPKIIEQKKYDSVIEMSKWLLDYGKINDEQKQKIYQLLGNSLFYTNRAQELSDLVKKIRKTSTGTGNPLVKWFDTQILLQRTP